MLTTLEREIRDLLGEARSLPINTPDEAEKARNLVERIRQCTLRAAEAQLPFTVKALVLARTNLERRMKLTREIIRAVEPVAN